MNNEQLVTQLRDLGNAAQSLATAITMLYANLSINIPSVDEQQEQNTNHCGQDADMDDACCQARNEEQPEGYTYKDLLGREVIGIGGMASTCAHCSDNVDCVKVELIGGTYMCLAKPQKEESITGLDDSPKSWEDVYRENMELVRRYSIEQSEANQRLLEALRSDSEETKKTVINFDEEESNIMDDIKEKTEDFLNYLDGIFNTKEQ